MQKELESIKKAKIRVVAVSFDAVETLAKFSEENKITFPLLSDPDSKTINAYGIRNKDVAEGSYRDGVPHPGTFLIGQDGVIRTKLFYTVRNRHSPKELIEVTPQNRMISYPYSKTMVSIMDLDMGAAILLTSHQKADALGVPMDRRVTLRGFCAAKDPAYVAERARMGCSPAMDSPPPSRGTDWRRTESGRRH